MIHSFIQTISIAPLQVHYYSEALSTQHGYSAGIVSKGLAQGPYVAARAGVEPMTLRIKGVDSTKAPPHPTICVIKIIILLLCSGSGICIHGQMLPSRQMLGPPSAHCLWYLFLNFLQSTLYIYHFIICIS